MANSNHRYKETFPSFPGEYQRNEQDRIKFLPYKELQKTCRAIDKGNKDPNKTYTACTKQYFLNCKDTDDSRPSSVTYFLKDIDKDPEFFENIRSHEDEHQRAIYANDLVRCHGGSSDLAKKYKKTSKSWSSRWTSKNMLKSTVTGTVRSKGALTCNKNSKNYSIDIQMPYSKNLLERMRASF